MRLFFFTLVSLLCLGASAQECTLGGRVTDDEGQALPMVTVRIEGTTEGGVTGIDGRYSFTFKSADTVRVVFSMVGFKSEKRTLNKPSGKQTITLQMKPLTIDMGEVTVKEMQRQMGSTQRLDIERTKRMPSTTGNAVEEMVATQAGVSTHNELSSQYNVRGGSFDENVVYINGVEVYRPMLLSSGQQEGLSIINGNMVKDIRFSAGGFEAKYGDKMSSVLDITYRRPERFEASASGNLLGADVYVGAKLGKFTMSHGFRYKTNSYLISALQEKGEYSPSYIDYQTYMSWSPSKRLSIDFIGHFSRNRYNFQPKNRETNFGTMENAKTFKVYFDGYEHDLFQTFFGTLQSTYKFNANTSLALLLSAYSSSERENYDISGEYWLDDTQTSDQLGVGKYLTHARNQIKTTVWSLAARFNHKVGAHNFEGGLTWKHESNQENTREWERRDSAGYNMPHIPDRLQMVYNLKSIADVTGNRIEVFAQDTWRREGSSGIWSLNGGLRFAYWSWNKEALVSPRVTVGWIPSWNDNFTFRAGAGLYYQAPFFKELRDTVMQANGNTSVVLNKDIKSTRSIQAVLGFDYRFKIAGRGFMFTTEAYYKHLSNLNSYTVDNVKIIYAGDNNATGYALGIDFKLYGEFVPNHASWISFSLMSAKQKLNGVWCPQPTDQLYNLNIFFTDFFPGSTRWQMTLKGCIAGGLPFTAPRTGMDRVNFRSSPYRRVDIGLSYRLLNNEDRTNRTFRFVRNIWLGLDCFNVFGLNNVSGYYWVTDVTNQQYAVPNYLTGRQINARLLVEF
ncbi:MAG: TonB-dependent receptor [Bacteroidaceae bacterium]|nr:TonB-dependent receptor [Bacteroidaceae bacterium]